MQRRQQIFWIFFLFVSGCFALSKQKLKEISDEKPSNYIFVESITEETLLPSIGNGYVSTFVYSKEVFISGLFNGFLNVSPSHRASIPSSFNYSISLCNTTEGTKLQNSGYLFDISHGTFTTFTSVTSNNGDIVAEIQQRWYAHREHRALIVHEISVNNSMSNNPLCLSISNGLSTFESADINFSELSSSATDVRCYNGSVTQPETLQGLQATVSICTDNLFIGNTYTITIPSHSESNERFVTTFQTNIPGDATDPSASALSLWKYYKEFNETLIEQHFSAWDSIWNGCGIEIEGTDDALRLQQVTNTSLYWILSSIRTDWPWSLSPGSLASNGYNGHTFWDTETWMYPTIMMLDSEIGKSILQYRANHLHGAERKAKTYNPQYEGAMFPWEDAYSGYEVCPKGVDTCRLEQHITGDIAFAMRQYWDNTRDIQWLADNIHIINEISRFWASRVTRNGTMFDINDVIPPDEYAVGVNNSVYTNVIAKMSFEFAKIAGEVLGRKVPEVWLQIAENLKIPFDDSRQIHLEYDGYTDEEIKQADVILLGFPLMYNMSKSIRENDLNFYSDVTDPNGPAMTWSMTSIGYIEMGNYEKAKNYFTKGFANAQEPFQVWTETPTGGTVNFITGCGGFLQNLLFGFPYLRLHQEYILFDTPMLPQNTTSITLRMLDYRGSQLNVKFDKSRISFELKELGPVTLSVSQTDSTNIISRNHSLNEVLLSRVSTTTLQLNKKISFPLLKGKSIVLFSQ